MLKFFSLPILVGIGAGILFPYQSMALIWTSSIVLFFLLFLNTLAVDARQVRQSLSQSWAYLLASVGLIFVFCPLLVAAAARLLIKDQDFAFGLVVSSLAPCALVNPFFAKIRGGDAPISLFTVLLTTLICPFITVPMLRAFGFTSIYLDSEYTIYFLVSLTVFPLLFSFIATRIWPKLPHLISPSLPWLNSLLLALLMFILVGSSLSRIPVRLLGESDLPAMIVFFLIADFGFFLLVKSSSRLFMNESLSETLALSVASRNFAVSASLMLFFHPKAAVPSAIGLIIHAVFFQWLLWKKTIPKAAAILFSLVFFAIQPRAEAQSLVRVCLPEYNEEAATILFLEALDSGFFQRAGLSVGFTFAKGRVLQTLAAQDCDVGVINIDDLFAATPAQLQKTKPIIEIGVPEKSGSRLFVRRNSSLNDFTDLKGKKVRLGSLHDRRVFERLAERADLAPLSYKAITDIKAMHVWTALENGSIDAAMISDPLAAIMLSSGKFIALPRPTSIKRDGALWTKRHFVVTNHLFARANDKNLKQLTRAMVDTSHYLERNPSRYFRALQKSTNLAGVKRWNVEKEVIDDSGGYMTETEIKSLLSPLGPKESATRKLSLNQYFEVLAGNKKPAPKGLVAWLTSL